MAKKIWLRIIPLITGVFFFSYLDRVNIGFAAVTMNRALGFSNAVFGAGAGAFAIGYALFGIPSTLILHRVGARLWISCMMIGWGVCSALTALVTTPMQLYVVRMALGLCEAGFIPGVIFYFTHWFPNQYRGRALSSFYSIGPLGLLIGGPASSALQSLNGAWGLAGWQWLFVVEALPTVFLAVAIYVLLVDRPSSAHWLSATEKQMLGDMLSSEHAGILSSKTAVSPWQGIRNARVWALAMVYLCIGTSGIGAVFFLPLMIKSMGFSVRTTGLLAGLPGIAAALALPLWGIWRDRSGRGELVVGFACCAIALGLSGAAVLMPSPWALLPISVAMMGFYGSLAAFWTVPSTFLVGASAAVGIGFINVVGNLGNFTGPALLGAAADQWGKYSTGLWLLAAIAATAVAILVAGADSRTKRVVL